MKIIKLLLFFGLTFFIVYGLPSKIFSQQQKPNILFIFTDDQAPTTIHALGNEEIITPNLDTMVSKGVTFTNAYNMGAWGGAVCISSRAMLNTGKSLWDAQKLDIKIKDTVIINSMWGPLMKKMGYDTYISGKWHVKTPAEQNFDNVVNLRPGIPKEGRTRDWSGFKKKIEESLAKNPEGFARDVLPIGYNRPLGPDDNSWSPSDTSLGGYWQGGEHWTNVLEKDAVSFIEDASQKENPFFMYISFNAPHDPRQSPQKFQDMYITEDLSIPESFQPLYPQYKEIANDPFLRDAGIAPFPRTEYATQVHKKEYYASITHIDVTIGKILDALEKSGKADNTYIIYTSDHGLAVGEHGLFGKQNMYDHSMKAPFIVIGPGLQGGRTVNENIYVQDAMATALELAGYEKNNAVFFNSVLSLAKGDSNQTSYPAIYGSYMDVQRMIKKDDYKLILYPDVPIAKLFDLTNDPNEMNNLADNHDQKERVKNLFNELTKLQNDLGDPLDLTETFTYLLN